MTINSSYAYEKYIKSIYLNMKDLKLTQEDNAQYIIFRNQEGAPILLIGNFSPDKLFVLVSNSAMKTSKDYVVNFNTWHSLRFTSHY
jgi:hypothetical protein